LICAVSAIAVVWVSPIYAAVTVASDCGLSAAKLWQTRPRPSSLKHGGLRLPMRRMLSSR
jgi:hypothetical protein